MNEIIDILQFGKDHWSLLGYIDSLCVEGVEGIGQINKYKMRCNKNTHPILNVNGFDWNIGFGTRLAGYFESKFKGDPEKAEVAGIFLSQHDDYDCLYDLADNGLIEIDYQSGLINGFVTLTKFGNTVAFQLREHKANGGQYAHFKYEAVNDNRNSSN
jgi:hypothetical protein